MVILIGFYFILLFYFRLVFWIEFILLFIRKIGIRRVILYIEKSFLFKIRYFNIGLFVVY